MMMVVERQLPRNRQDHQSGQRRRNDAFADHPGDGRLDEGRIDLRLMWSSSPAGNPASILGSRALTPAIIVERH